MAIPEAFPRPSRDLASSSIKAGSVELVPKTAAGSGQKVSQLPEIAMNCHETWSLKSMKRIGKSSLNEVCSMKLMLRMSTAQFGKTKLGC